MSSCSEGEPPQSPIENYLPSGRSRSPIISSSMPPHTSATTQSDVDSLRLLLQEVKCFLLIKWIYSMKHICNLHNFMYNLVIVAFI